MKRNILIVLIACLAVAGYMAPALAEDVAPAKRMAGQSAQEVMAAQEVGKVVPHEDHLLFRVDKSDRVYTRLKNTKLKIVSFFHQRKIGDAIVEKDFIRYQFDTETDELIETTKKWREGLPDTVEPAISQDEAENMVEGEVTSSQLVIISPESEIFHIKPTPENPCWIVRSIYGDRKIVTVIDSMTGEKLGYGVPAPYEGLSIHGPDHPPNCDNNNPLWTTHATNAETWFETMGYDTQRIGSATAAQISSHIQSDTTVMFYELDHGGSTSFKNRCEDDTYASEVETWISNYASMGFSFIGSCEGLCNTADNTFSYEFRKGSSIDTVTIGYCHMSDDALCELDCWPHAVAWQTELFNRMNQGYTVGTAYAYANAAYPDCTDDGHYCMRIAGDPNLVFGGSTYPNVRRSFCGPIYDIYILPGLYISPLTAVMSRTYTRAHHIRCNSYVPSGYWLTMVTSTSYPYNEVAFVNNSKLTATGPMTVNAGDGQITFVSSLNRGKGMKVTGEMNMLNNGAIRVYE